MKRTLTLTMIAVSIITFAACKKDSNLGNLGEGIYQPNTKISQLSAGSTPVETWEWGTSKLAGVNNTEEGATYSFSYAGDMVSNVTISYSNGDPTENIYYTYQGSLLSHVEIVQGTTTCFSMQVMHNANDKISSMNIDISDSYLATLAMELMSRGKSSKAIAHVLPASAVSAMASVAEALPHRNGDAKLMVSNKHFDMTYTWDGDNLMRTVLSGNVSATATLNDVADAFDFGTIGSIIGSMLGDDEWPLSCTVSSTTNYTYDEKKNPYQYCWKDGVDAGNLSKNNLVSAVTTGSADATITVTLPESVPMMGGMTYPYTRNIDLGEKHSYSYTYNKKKYPESITVDGKSYNVTYVK